MFAAAGLPMAECEIVSSSEDAARAAGRMGYPLVIKGAAPEISHKSDLGLVRVGLHTAADVSAAYLDVAAALARETRRSHASEKFISRRWHGLESN